MSIHPQVRWSAEHFFNWPLRMFFFTSLVIPFQGTRGQRQKVSRTFLLIILKEKRMLINSTECIAENGRQWKE